MAAPVKAIPDGYHTVTPHMVIRDVGGAIEFYKKAFGAEELFRMPGPDGQSIMHAEIKIGDSIVMMCEEMPEGGDGKAPQSLSGTCMGLHIYVEDVDKAFQRAIDAGAKPSMPVMDMFWGDRYGKVTDPFGHHWSLATHKQDVTPEQCAKGAEEFFKNMTGCGQ